jgi:predicted nucleic acid-binding protein
VDSLDQLQQSLVKAKICGFDTMLFIYLFDQNPRFLISVKKIFELAEAGKIEIITSIISPLEILSHPQIKLQPQKEGLYQDFFLFMKNLKVVDISWKIILKAAELRRSFPLRTPDALQLATAITNQAKIFLTNDQIFQKVNNFPILQLADFL